MRRVDVVIETHDPSWPSPQRQILAVPVGYMGGWDAWVHLYDRLPVVTRAALAHLHGRHAEPTMYCPLCGFDPDDDVGGDS